MMCWMLRWKMRTKRFFEDELEEEGPEEENE